MHGILSTRFILEYFIPGLEKLEIIIYNIKEFDCQKPDLQVMWMNIDAFLFIRQIIFRFLTFETFMIYDLGYSNRLFKSDYRMP